MIPPPTPSKPAINPEIVADTASTIINVIKSLKDIVSNT